MGTEFSPHFRDAGAAVLAKLHQQSHKLSKDAVLEKSPVKCSSTNLVCAICFGINGRACRGCYSVAYCSREHQIWHWPIHQYVCRPLVTIQKEEVLYNLSLPSEERSSDPYVGMYKAARELKPKETVLHLQPIMHVAYNKGMPIPPDSILCLGCNRWYQYSQGYRCTKCKWPVCSERCELDTCHAQYECKVFTDNKVYPPTNPTYYNGDIVLALRCLLLKKTKPADWEQLMAMEPVVERAVRARHYLDADEKVAHYLVYNCRVQDSLSVTFQEVMCLLKIIDFCSVWLPERWTLIWGKEPAFVSAKYVFPIKLFVAEECAPNCSWSLWPSPKVEECSIRLRASVLIQPGQYISASFSGISDFGASFPKRYEHCRFSYKCKCRRCEDPTEGGTFFSGVKCFNCSDSTQGYLVPENPSDYNSIWRCHNSSCNGTKPSSEISSEIDRIHNEIKKQSNSLQGLLNLIKENEKVKLHPNHYLIMKATQLSILQCLGVLDNTALHNLAENLLDRAKVLTDKLGNIYKAIYPSDSLENAKFLFQYQMIHGVSRVRELLRLFELIWMNQPVEDRLFWPNKFWDLVKIQRASLEVLMTEPFGSKERELAVIMKVVMEDTEALLLLERWDSKIQYETLLGLFNIYSVYCSGYLHSFMPIFEDKQMNEFGLFTGPYCREFTYGS